METIDLSFDVNGVHVELIFSKFDIGVELKTNLQTVLGHVVGTSLLDTLLYAEGTVSYENIKSIAINFVACYLNLSNGGS